MSFDFSPLTEEQLELAEFLPEGWYDFEVIKSERKTSKAGNPMCALQLKVWGESIKIVFDYLVFSSVNLNIKKVKRFCDTTGLAEEYKKGSIREDLQGLCGRVFIGIQDEMPNPNGGMYPKKNVVVEYAKEEFKLKEIKEDKFNDEIPF